MRLVFLVFFVFVTLTLPKPFVDTSLAQTVSLSKTFQAIEATYTTNSTLGANQFSENESVVKDYPVMNNSFAPNPITNNPTYSVTNATTSVKIGTVEGDDSNKAALRNQSITLPNIGVLTGQNSFQEIR